MVSRVKIFEVLRDNVIYLFMEKVKIESVF